MMKEGGKRSVLVMSCVLVSVVSATVAAQSSSPPGQSRAAVPRLEEVFVTAGRAESVRGNIAQQVELISFDDIQATPASFATDFLKKNASLDVIQYPGGLSGVGMRGFRPQFSGINQQVLILVDGRPAGATSLGNLPQSGIERVEVVKGSSSSVYGASAMGGVVNVITRRSRDEIKGEAYARVGSFETVRAGFRVGGQLTDAIDFDIGIDERSQYDDFDLGSGRTVINGQVLGDGATRPFTSFQTRSAYLRLGADIGTNWRADARAMGFRGKDMEAPGAESVGSSQAANNNNDAYSLDARITGSYDRHDLQAVVFLSKEDRDRRNANDGLLGLFGTGGETRFRGFQLSDSYRINSTYSVVAGLDYEDIERINVAFDNEGAARAPFAPNEDRETVGVYADFTARYLDERLILNAGVRRDRIKSALEVTRLRPDFIPGNETFTTTNPRAGVVFFPMENRQVRLHASAGRGFVVPSVRQVAGSTESVQAGQLRILSGNPDLSPESSVSLDLGVGYAGADWDIDLTWFRTDVEDKIESIELVNTSELRETTSVNAGSALAQGWELTFSGLAPAAVSRALGGEINYEISSTYYTDREQDLPAGTEPLRNVARFKVNGNLGYTRDRFSMRFIARHVVGMIDRDFSRDRIFTAGAGGEFRYPDIAVFDLNASYALTERQTIGLQVENLTDEYYYEKNDFPMQGRLLLASYRFQF